MHMFVGLTLEDWASLIAILGGIGGAIMLIIRFTSIMNKLQSAIQTLNSTLSRLVHDSQDEHKRVDNLEGKVDELTGDNKVQDTRLDHLENKVFEREDLKP